MSLIPAFEIGVWNAWIFMLYNFLPMPFLTLMHRPGEPAPPSDNEKKLRPFAWIVWILAFIYSVFLPLKLGTIWFYIGLPIALVGLITFTMVMVTFLQPRSMLSHLPQDYIVIPDIPCMSPRP